jgi:hypothetical protein
MKHIKNLPEKIETKEVIQLINELITSKLFFDEQLDILEELSDKQWHNYEKLPSKVIDELEYFLFSNFLNINYEMLEIYLQISIHLGLQKIYTHLINKKGYNIQEQKLITEYKEELGFDISDPYISYKKPDTI